MLCMLCMSHDKFFWSYLVSGPSFKVAVLYSACEDRVDCLCLSVNSMLTFGVSFE